MTGRIWELWKGPSPRLRAWGTRGHQNSIGNKWWTVCASQYEKKITNKCTCTKRIPCSRMSMQQPTSLRIHVSLECHWDRKCTNEPKDSAALPMSAMMVVGNGRANKLQGFQGATLQGKFIIEALWRRIQAEVFQAVPNLFTCISCNGLVEDCWRRSVDGEPC